MISRVSILASVLLLAACTQSGLTDTPYKEEFDMYLSWDLSDFERSVLEDYQIEAHEYKEAQQRYLDCLAQYGITGTVNDDGTGTVIYPGGINTYKEDAVNDTKCHTEHLANIDTLYQEMRMNPEKKDEAQGLLDCVIREGILMPGATYEEFDEILMELGDDPRIIECTRDPFGIL